MCPVVWSPFVWWFGEVWQGDRGSEWVLREIGGFHRLPTPSAGLGPVCGSSLPTRAVACGSPLNRFPCCAFRDADSSR
jgi:hypothetical protein